MISNNFLSMLISQLDLLDLKFYHRQVYFNKQNIDSSWEPIIDAALARLDPHYIEKLKADDSWLPGPEKIFNAFSLPKSQVKVILLGESPYPRAASANGYAFWDAAVARLWSDTGLSKTVNRATSLRNFIKMLLVAEGLLPADNTNQAAIQAIDKHQLIETNQSLFENLLKNGFLLLNASLVFRAKQVKEDAKAWRPFIETVLNALLPQKPWLLLLGKIAQTLPPSILNSKVKKIIAPHPYNLSFITHPEIINFFRALTLLKKKAKMSCKYIK